jgi:hypothetical protein
MDDKRVEEVMRWAKDLRRQHGGEAPDWAAYKKLAYSRLGYPPGSNPAMPDEYTYVYHRIKGLSHSEALARLNPAGPGNSAARKPVQQKTEEKWWKFW